MEKIKLINIELGKRIRLERERLELNQESFASINGLAARTVIDWEKGKSFPNLLQLVHLVEKGLNIKALFDDLFSDRLVERLGFKDVTFVEIKQEGYLGDFELIAINKINQTMSLNPQWKLINIETRSSENGEDTGLRYYYTYPVIMIFDESQIVRDACLEDLFKTSREYSHKNRW